MTSRRPRWRRRGSRSSRERGPKSATSPGSTSCCRSSRGAITCDSPSGCALLERMAQAGAPAMLNPPALLRWNSDKAYLEQLAAAGVPTVASRTVAALDDAALAEARAAFGDQLVVKPLVSAAADDTFRLGPDDPIPASVRGKRMLVQPFMPSIASSGEYSLMLFGGAFSHAIVKRPKAGDFRVQPHLGGSETPCAPPDGAIALAQAALAAAPGARGLCAGRHDRRRRRGLADHGTGTDRAGAVAAARPRQGRGTGGGDQGGNPRLVALVPRIAVVDLGPRAVAGPGQRRDRAEIREYGS